MHVAIATFTVIFGKSSGIHGALRGEDKPMASKTRRHFRKDNAFIALHGVSSTPQQYGFCRSV